jgi:ribosome maturation factor RimP
VKDLEERIRSLAEPVLARHDAELVELQVKEGPVSLVRIVADRPSGIDLDTCAKVSAELSRMLDVDDPIEGRYTLEVSSPGVNRPLETADDFARNMGRRVKIVLEDSQLEGTIEEVGADAVTVRLGGGRKGPKVQPVGEAVSVPLDQIRKAKIVLPW